MFRFVATVLLSLCALAASAQQVETAFYEGQPAKLQFAATQRKEKAFTFGTWRFGPKLLAPRAGKPDKPHDRRLNLYIVVPGSQHRSAQPEFDHNVIINALSPQGRDAEYDVFWAIMLDPKLREDVRTEDDLLLMAHQEFIPHDLFEFDDLPTAEFLREVQKTDALTQLRAHRRKKGALPRVLIVPAGFALRVAATR